MLTRTGCTGEIGYELFIERSSAPRGSGRMCWKPCSTPPRGRESRPASRSCFARFLTELSLGDKISGIRGILRGHARAPRGLAPFRTTRSQQAPPGSSHTWPCGPRQSPQARGANGARSIGRTGSRNARTQTTAEQEILATNHPARCCARGRGFGCHRIAGPERLAVGFAGNPRGRAARLRQARICAGPARAALNAGGTNTVGAVIPTINHAIFAAFLEALEARLDTNGYCLLIATTGMDRRVELERARSLLEMGARALIVTGLGSRTRTHRSGQAVRSARGRNVDL